MAHLGHVGSLQLKWKSNWNDIKTNPNMIWKLLIKLNQLLKKILKLTEFKATQLTLNSHWKCFAYDPSQPA